MHRFLTLLQKDLRYFLYLEGLLMLFRVAFLVLFRSQLNAVSASEILYALYLGFRISLKTTVLLVGLPFLLATGTGKLLFPLSGKSREDPPYRPFPLCHDLSFCGAHSLLCHFPGNIQHHAL